MSRSFWIHQYVPHAGNIWYFALFGSWHRIRDFQQLIIDEEEALDELYLTDRKWDIVRESKAERNVILLGSGYKMNTKAWNSGVQARFCYVARIRSVISGRGWQLRKNSFLSLFSWKYMLIIQKPLDRVLITECAEAKESILKVLFVEFLWRRKWFEYSLL